MTALDVKIDSFKYDVIIARVMEAIDTEALEKNYDPEIVAMVAYETAYESKESDKDLDVDALTFDSFVSSVIESANLIIVHNLFD
ncbi:hypothetical protein VPEG_00034 [Vibrio phage SIO-2]|uniref:hypothetical protein n=1 Tax=Vibrio phage SIO-2 TaxID=700512 RepID=UPI0002357C48|nr:hypothetical protein VPEG_00034 [Vibrio phage SIO-2]AET42185.1 hypothetical protein VPEG_00034 [Vibrio phage SIO-2]